MMNLKYITIAAVLIFTFFGCASEIKKITYDVQGVNYTIKIPKGYK
ncbi:unknown [Prevotella sp. CAG:1185]|nr:unknown [Prevotella sp. CAG:1185]